MKPRIAIVGGGFAGLRALYGLRSKLGEDVQITLIDSRSTSLAKPALPEVGLSGKSVDQVRFPLQPILEHAGGTFLQGNVDRVDPVRREILLDDGRFVGFDYVFLAVGALKDYDATPGFSEYGYSICDDTHAPRAWEALKRFEGGPIVVGSALSEFGSYDGIPALAAPCEGPIGEIMFMLDRELRHRGLRDRTPITVFSPAEIFFEDVGEDVRGAVGPLIAQHDITVHTSKVLTRIAEDHVEFADGTTLPSAMTFIIPVYRGNPMVERSRLGDEHGFVPTDRTMRHIDHANVFAAGDGTALAMPKLGHIAVMQADIAVASMVREITGEGEIPPFAPEIFCIMNRGGQDATLIYSDIFFGGTHDVAMSGKLPHMMKWGFDQYYYHTRGHLPPELMERGAKALLERFD